MKASFIVLLWLMFVWPIQSQGLNKEVYPKQAAIEHNQAVKRFSRDFVLTTESSRAPIGMQAMLRSINNVAGIRIRGEENITVLQQEGAGLIGFMNVRGDGNDILVQQEGYDLLSLVNIRGNANRLTVSQQGLGLQHYLQISGSGLQFDARQTQRGFVLEQHGYGSIPMTIEQTGGMVPLQIITN
jgi:hypothetical protein